MANQHTKRQKSALNDSHRERIQASQIINRLHKCIMGEVELSTQQVAAARALLNKVLPDLQATQITGELEQRYVARIPEPVADTEEWRKQHSPTTH